MDYLRERRCPRERTQRPVKKRGGGYLITKVQVYVLS